MLLRILPLLFLLALEVSGLVRPVVNSEPVTLLHDSQPPRVKRYTLAERNARGIKPRHWRPVFERDSPNAISGPDVGQIANPIVPHRGNMGSSFTGPDTNPVIDNQNPDNVAPPPTDGGIVPNLKWSFSLSHEKLTTGGMVREQTVTDLPPSVDIAASELRLEPNAYRELHWHRIAEWALVLNGSGRVAAVDEDGRSFLSDITGPGDGQDPDMYYFPAGVPHSVQALEDGLELLCIFPDGNFDALGTTFMLSDWLVHTPLEIVAQNFGLNTSAFDNVPQVDPYALPATVPPPPLGHGAGTARVSPEGVVPNPFVFRLSKQEREVAPGGGGWWKVQDSVSNFPASINIASAYVFIEPNGMRELHWHTNDEWIYVIQGHGRFTGFAGSATSRTFDVQVGDTAVIPISYGHYIKNISPTEPLIFLEVFRAAKFVDFSALQWLALTPPQVTADLLKIPIETVKKFPTHKPVIVA